MRDFKLKTIEIKDFKAQNRVVNFFEKTRITGRNAIGKTTVVSAFNWLLTGLCDANTNKNADLFDNRFELKPETPKASVRAVIELDGETHTIERTAKAKFKKERGTNEPKKDTSDDYGFIIDDIEVPARRFDEWIGQNIAPIDVLKFCISGEFFSNLVNDDWQKARLVLLAIVGEIKDSDFKKDYSLIQSMLKTFSLDEIKERSKKRITEYDKSIENTNIQITANQEKIAEYSAIDYDEIEGEIKSCEDEIADIDKRMSESSSSIEPYVKKRNEAVAKRQELQNKLDELRRLYNTDQQNKESDVKSQISRIDKENADIESRNERKKREYNANVNRKTQLENEKNRIENETTALREELHEIKARVYNEENCAFCGQKLPEEMLESGRAKFNEKKEADKKRVVEKGKANNARVEAINTEIAELEAVIAKGVDLEKPLSKADLEAQLAKLQSSFVPFERTETFTAKTAEINAIVIPEIPTIDNTENTNRKAELIGKIKQLSGKLGFRDEIARLNAKNEEAKENIRKFCDESAKEKMIIDNCKQRQEEIAEITSNRVNGRMRNTVITMQKQQKDGQSVPYCEITQNNGVKFATSNGAARILMRVDLQVMFCEHYGIAMPIFVDECSILDDENLPNFEGHQIVYLYNSNNNFKVEEVC